MDALSIAIVVGFFLVAMLYSTVGHAGASGYLAIMALLSVAPEQMKLTALVLNLVVAGVASLNFARAGHLSWSLTLPCLASSIPSALIGGALTVSTTFFKLAVSVTLLFAAYRLASPRVREKSVVVQPAPLVLFAAGAGLGLLAGLTGTGGGIFLSPLLVLMGWATVNASSATASVFILANSAAGLAGHVLVGKNATQMLEPRVLVAAALAVLVGGFIGSRAGARHLVPVWTRRLLSLVLVIAAAKLALVL